MNAEQIKGFLDKNVGKGKMYVKISFHKRDALYGLFLTEFNDYQDLSSKNFWRIVTQKNFDAYNKSNDINLSRLFNGSEMTRLSLLEEEFS